MLWLLLPSRPPDSRDLSLFVAFSAARHPCSISNFRFAYCWSEPSADLVHTPRFFPPPRSPVIETTASPEHAQQPRPTQHRRDDSRRRLAAGTSPRRTARLERLRRPVRLERPGALARALRRRRRSPPRSPPHVRDDEDRRVARRLQAHAVHAEKPRRRLVQQRRGPGPGPGRRRRRRWGRRQR